MADRQIHDQRAEVIDRNRRRRTEQLQQAGELATARNRRHGR